MFFNFREREDRFSDLSGLSGQYFSTSGFFSSGFPKSVSITMTDTLKLQFKNRDFSDEILLVKKKKGFTSSWTTISQKCSTVLCRGAWEKNPLLLWIIPGVLYMKMHHFSLHTLKAIDYTLWPELQCKSESPDQRQFYWHWHIDQIHWAWWNCHQRELRNVNHKSGQRVRLVDIWYCVL